MPTTTEGILLVIGALFLLIGFIGGGFEVSAAKIPPVGKVGRIGSVLVGFVFLALAAYPYLTREARTPSTGPSGTGEPQNPEPAQPARTADECIPGFVWREAGPSDHVCVTPGTRTRTAQENSQADATRSPNGGPYGRDTCVQGYVWRDAFPGDHVCVTGQSRTDAAYDNSQAALRVAR